MKLIEFPEQTIVIAKNQPEYNPLPAYQVPDDVSGRIICCWKLTFKERIKLLFGGKIWHHILTFNKSLQPQLLDIKSPFIKTTTTTTTQQ